MLCQGTDVNRTRQMLPLYASQVAPWQRTHLPMEEAQARSLGQGEPLDKKNGNPLQYCLEISMDKEVWRATSQGVTNGLDMTEQLNQQNHVHMEHILQPSSFVIRSSGAAKDE